MVEAITQQILQGELVPGQRLVEAELCELLGVTRTTIRNAFIDLEHDGLIEKIANRGARVRVVGLQEALHIAEVRRVVEGLCVRRAAQRITDDEIVEFRRLNERMKEAAAGNGTASFPDLTHEAFEFYVRVADQPVAEEVLTRLRARNIRHRFRLTYRPGRAQVALPFWNEIIDAICSRDPDRAEKGLFAHSENVQEVMKAIAQEHKPFAALYSNDE